MNWPQLPPCFDTIQCYYISFGFERLCPTGLVTGRYAEISLAFMELLPCGLPVGSIPCVLAAIVDAVSMESNNGYDLLFHVMVLAVPGFDPTLLLSAPVWSSSTDLFKFCRSHHFYFRIQGKKGIFFDDRTRSGIFLNAICSSEYADVVMTLQSHIDCSVETSTTVAFHTTYALMALQKLSTTTPLRV
jgi:hypothetical protein